VIYSRGYIVRWPKVACHCFWHRQELYIYAYQSYLSCPGKTQVHITSHFSLLHRLRYNLSIFGKGKKSAWEAWESYPEVAQAFIYMATQLHTLLTVESLYIRHLEHLSVIVYDKTSCLVSVDEVWKELFCQKNRTMENIPPTQDVLLQHCNE